MTLRAKPYSAAMFAAFVFVCGLLPRLSYVYSMEIDYPFRADAGKYLQLAINLVENHGYSLAESAPFTPSTLISPGYPAFLAVILDATGDIQHFYNTVLLSQALLSSLTVVGAFYLALRIGGLQAAVPAGLLVALSPQLIIGAGYILTETLSSFLITFCLALLLAGFSRGRPTLFVACGVVLALAAYVRPAVLLLPGTLLPLAWWTRNHLKNCLIMAVTAAVIWSPWQIWQSKHRQAGEVSLAAAALTLGGYPDLIFKSPEFKAYPYREDPQYAAMSQSLGEAYRVIRERAAAEPWKFLNWYVFGKPMMYWQAEEVAGPGGPYVYNINSSVFTRQAIPAASLNGMMALHPFIIALTAAACLWTLIDLCRRRSSPATQPAWLLCAALVVYFTAVHTVLAPLPRYAFPIYPIAYALAAGLVARMPAWLRRRADETT
ncbi:hypothetical protein BJL95_08255 [Methylomonas sp. LWB]|uniref:glycosyltransferase family 39 protein n=1 Tax=Methylomonas sp. LWB TaxID=1905845 RepID=UPI0008D90E39|nr:glycosyltransferase family 39 protein [Methylomonas sp. LWB]OHX37782.1 hypothetical protein BJL95_08255 [Methylomonas sp. LWB]